MFEIKPTICAGILSFLFWVRMEMRLNPQAEKRYFCTQYSMLVYFILVVIVVIVVVVVVIVYITFANCISLFFSFLLFFYQLNYIFYGVHKLDLRCRHFFDDSSNLFLQWSEFAHENEERLLCARDGIEQYVMTRIAEYAFKTVLDSEGDDILLRRMKLLSFLKPEV